MIIIMIRPENYTVDYIENLVRDNFFIGMTKVEIKFFFLLKISEEIDIDALDEMLIHICPMQSFINAYLHLKFNKLDKVTYSKLLFHC